MSGIKVQNKTGSTVKAGEYTLQPISQSVSWVGRQGGAIWNRPYAIQVEQSGVVEEIPIRDLTRIGQVVLWGLTALFSLITIKTYFKKRSRSNE